MDVLKAWTSVFQTKSATTAWITSPWSILVVWAQDVEERPTTVVTTVTMVCIQFVSSSFTSLRLIRGETMFIHLCSASSISYDHAFFMCPAVPSVL